MSAAKRLSTKLAWPGDLAGSMTARRVGAAISGDQNTWAEAAERNGSVKGAESPRSGPWHRSCQAMNADAGRQALRLGQQANIVAIVFMVGGNAPQDLPCPIPLGQTAGVVVGIELRRPAQIDGAWNMRHKIRPHVYALSRTTHRRREACLLISGLPIGLLGRCSLCPRQRSYLPPSPSCEPCRVVRLLS